MIEVNEKVKDGIVTLVALLVHDVLLNTVKAQPLREKVAKGLKAIAEGLEDGTAHPGK